MAQAARRRIVAKERLPQEAPNGWMTMGAHELLAFHAQTMALKDRGFSTYDAGEAWSDDLQRDVPVFGTYRTAANLQTSLVAVMLTGTGKLFADTSLRLQRRADKMGMPFEADTGVAHVGVEARDFDAADRDTAAKVLTLSIEAEDAMAAFIRSARDGGLLAGVTINVPDLSQR